MAQDHETSPATVAALQSALEIAANAIKTQLMYETPGSGEHQNLSWVLDTILRTLGESREAGIGMMQTSQISAETERPCRQCDRRAEPGGSLCRPCILEDEACEAFWAVIARHFPDAKFGDLSPEATIRQRLANSDAIAEWISNNVPEK